MQRRTISTRNTTIMLIALLGCVVVGYARAAPPSDVKPPDLPDQYFCCESVDPTGNDGAGTGVGCVKTTEDAINGCVHWLICPGGATGSDGVVTCTAPKK